MPVNDKNLMKKVKEKELLDYIVPKSRSIPDMDFEEKTFELFGDDPFFHRRAPLGLIKFTGAF